MYSTGFFFFKKKKQQNTSVKNNKIMKHCVYIVLLLNSHLLQYKQFFYHLPFLRSVGVFLNFFFFSLYGCWDHSVGV